MSEPVGGRNEPVGPPTSPASPTTVTAAPPEVAGAVDAVAGAEDPGLLGAGLGVLGPALRVAGHGGNAARAALGFSAEALRVLGGSSTVAAPKGDWRFKDPTWDENPIYRRLKQLYLAGSESIFGLIDDAGLGWRDAERARFAATIASSALAPTNTLVGNPAALKRAFETGGTSLLRGLRHFVSDVRHNGGLPTQVDKSAFRIGGNLAASPGAVIHRDDVAEVIQFAPTSAEVRSRPLVLIPPMINKYYFLDLAPGRSMVEYLTAHGIPVFCLSWRNPRREHRDWDLDTYAAAALRAIDAAREVARSDDVNLLGACAGGILTTTVLAHLAAEGDGTVHSVTFGVTLLDFEVPAMIGLFHSPTVAGVAKRRSAVSGVLDGRSLASVFTWARPNDLVWNYWVSNYLMGNKPPAFDILAWNADQTNLPARLHSQFLDIFLSNGLARPSTFTVLGTPVDAGRIKCDAYVTGGTTDHLTPWQGCYRTTQLLGGSSTFVLANTGHVQTMVCPPGNPKSRYQAGPEPGPDPDAWRAAAEEHTGTWWEHWLGWLTARSGAERKAPSKLGSRRHPVLDPAPGRYVHDR